MRQTSVTRFLGVVALVLLGSCETTPPRFSHTRHRSDYAITLDELKTMRFYISSEVILQPRSTPGAAPAAGAVRVTEGTAGVVVDAGPDWLRVAFGQGSGVFFLADVYDRSYYLATEIEGAPGLKAVFQLPDRTLLQDGVPYEIVRGRDAVLLVNEVDLERIERSRAVIQGRSPATAPSR